MDNFSYGIKSKKTELLAPAGSFEALRAAVLNGADAVYFGASRFSARAGAANFTDEELPRAADFCHLRGAKAYLAVNTVYLEREFDDLCGLIRLAAKSGIDGCIVQDLGAAKLIRETAPSMPVHASTQMTVHSIHGVRALHKEGIKRVVLSRELKKSEIEYICKNTDAETEIFVHGALCICYSGKCLLSSAIGGRSGNRGKCAQPCRLKYTMDGKSGYLLSPKDLCLAGEIETLKNIGVSSLKIEGRMKSPEYVAVVVGTYRKIIDSGKVTKEDIERLRAIFCRGDEFSDDYFKEKDEKHLINCSSSNDDISLKADASLIKTAAKTFAEGAEIRRIQLDFDLSREDGKAVLTVTGAGQTAKEIAEFEDAPPLSSERAKAQLSKLGSTPFLAGTVNAADGLAIRVSTLNGLRRAAIEKISELICESFRHNITDFKYKRRETIGKEKTLLAVSVCTAEQAKAATDKCDALCIPAKHFDLAAELAEEKDVYLAIPVIIEKEFSDEIRNILGKAVKSKIRGAVCGSIDAMALASEFDIPLIGGYGLNITNGLAADLFNKMGLSAAVASAELSLSDIKSLAHQTDLPIGFVSYGRLRLMQTKHCFMKPSHCGECKAELCDRTGTVFPVRRAYPGHGNIIYNSRPIYLADKQKDDLGAAFEVMSFTTETPRECEKIIEMYKKCEAPPFEFTRGGQSSRNW
ncbi:MAG: U32 family peptidase [Clostridia bacterium]|nr:U32 family peptidase [Clostridia bacterium]